MIGRLTGNIVESRPEEILLDVGGVGYRLHVPVGTDLKLGERGTVVVHVHTHVREDAIQLFGFATTEERAAFEGLISVSGIGPKLALAVLSGIDADDLGRAVREGDRAVLEKVPGIGRKTAERMILELRDRWPAAGVVKGRRGLRVAGEEATAPGDAVVADAVAALLHLGYNESVATEAVVRVRRDGPPEGPLQDVLRAALRALAR